MKIKTLDTKGMTSFENIRRILFGWARDVKDKVNDDKKLELKAVSSDPDDPSNDNCVMWLSDGTGSGDAGDLMIKITVSGTTKTGTIIDFSAI